MDERRRPLGYAPVASMATQMKLGADDATRASSLTVVLCDRVEEVPVKNVSTRKHISWNVAAERETLMCGGQRT